MFSTWKIAAVGAAVAVLFAAVAWIRHDAKSDIQQDIKNENAKALGAADSASIDYLSCVNLGGVWVFESGKCRWASEDRR